MESSVKANGFSIKQKMIMDIAKAALKFNWKKKMESKLINIENNFMIVKLMVVKKTWYFKRLTTANLDIVENAMKDWQIKKYTFLKSRSNRQQRSCPNYVCVVSDLTGLVAGSTATQLQPYRLFLPAAISKVLAGLTVPSLLWNPLLIVLLKTVRLTMRLGTCRSLSFLGNQFRQ